MRKKDQKNLLKVGLFFTALTLVIMILVVSIGKENSIFQSKVDIHARVQNVSNLKPGSYVELKGIRVGTVTDIQIISEDEVEITATILASHMKWIKKDSLVSVSNAGLVGDKFLEIYDGSKDAPIFDPQKDFLASEDATDIKKILTKGESIASVTERILNKIDLILNRIDDGQRIAKTMQSITKSTQNLEIITSELKNAHVGAMVMNVNESMKSLNKTSSSMEKIMTRIEKGPGTMNSLIFDDSLHEELRALLGGAQRNKIIKYYIRESIENSERKKAKSNN